MTWKYKQHNLISKPLYGVIGLCQFVLDLSWKYAHYRNGWFVTGPDCYPKKTPDLFFKNQSFWWCVKCAWKGRHHND